MEPIVGKHYLHKNKVYKVQQTSKATDVVWLLDISTHQEYTEKYSLFRYAYERVIKVTEAARLLERYPRTIYSYEARGQIEKPFVAPNPHGCMVRFYTEADLFNMYELLAQMHRGRPSKDPRKRRVVNNTLPNQIEFKKRVKEYFGNAR